ncbi:hypothetical protein QJQ45_022803 [Haematococcus lacustris]|nr:hypothetical protein QJQ45_022803 [Haematococcus lacustris]
MAAVAVRTLGKKLGVTILNEYCKAVGLYVPAGTLRLAGTYAAATSEQSVNWISGQLPPYASAPTLNTVAQHSRLSVAAKRLVGQRCRERDPSWVRMNAGDAPLSHLQQQQQQQGQDGMRTQGSRMGRVMLLDVKHLLQAQVSSIGNEAWAELQAMRPSAQAPQLRNLTEVVQVQGKTAADKYLVFPAHFCSCQAFFYEVVNKGEAVCCKHQLAARVSWSLQRCPVLVVSDVQLAQFLINAS